MKILPSNVANNRLLGWEVFSTANRPKSQILFHKNVSPHNLPICNIESNIRITTICKKKFTSLAAQQQ